MKKIVLGILASMILLPVIPFAQTMPQPPAEWVAFQKQENAKRAAFMQELNADRQAFISTHPEMQSYFQQMHAAAHAHLAAWRAAHPLKTTNGTPL